MVDLLAAVVADQLRRLVGPRGAREEDRGWTPRCPVLWRTYALVSLRVAGKPARSQVQNPELRLRSVAACAPKRRFLS